MLISVIGDMMFGKKLRKIREAKGITQQQLAEKLGFSQTAMFPRLKWKVYSFRGKAEKACQGFKSSLQRN